MFSNARVNQQIFILDKANRIFEVGNVCEEPKTRYNTVQSPQQFNNPYYQQPITVTVVDLKVMTPNGIQTLKGLPSDNNVFDNEAKTVFVTEEKELMLNELRTLKNQSENHVKQTPYHQEMIGKYESWIGILNPEEAERKRNEQKMEHLENALAQQTAINQQIMEQLQLLSKQNEMLMQKGTEDKSKNTKNKDKCVDSM